jgi:hypothetical protein
MLMIQRHQASKPAKKHGKITFLDYHFQLSPSTFSASSDLSPSFCTGRDVANSGGIDPVVHEMPCS